MELTSEVFYSRSLVLCLEDSVPKLVEDEVLLGSWVVAPLLQLELDDLVLELFHDTSGGGCWVDEDESQTSSRMSHPKSNN